MVFFHCCFHSFFRPFSPTGEACNRNQGGVLLFQFLVAAFVKVLWQKFTLTVRFQISAPLSVKLFGAVPFR